MTFSNFDKETKEGKILRDIMIELHNEKVARDNHYNNKKKIAEESAIVQKTPLSRLAIIFPRLRMTFAEWIIETKIRRNYTKEWIKHIV